MSLTLTPPIPPARRTSDEGSRDEEGRAGLLPPASCLVGRAGRRLAVVVVVGGSGSSGGVVGIADAHGVEV